MQHLRGRIAKSDVRTTYHVPRTYLRIQHCVSALRCRDKNWDAGYHELLDMLDLPSLAQRRLHTRLCYVYKIVHGLLYFPPDVVVPSSALSHNPRSHLLYQPFAHTNSYLHSFILNSISNWNMLPDYVVSSPSFTSFKYNLSL